MRDASNDELGKKAKISTTAVIMRSLGVDAIREDSENKIKSTETERREMRMVLRRHCEVA